MWPKYMVPTDILALCFTVLYWEYLVLQPAHAITCPVKWTESSSHNISGVYTALKSSIHKRHITGKNSVVSWNVT